MKNIIKVLLINASDKFGGVSSTLFNYYENICGENIKFDFLSPKKTSFEIKRKEIEKNLDNIYELNVHGDGLTFNYNTYKKLKEFFQKNDDYDIVHINSGLVFYNAACSIAAKKYAKNAKIIVHNHSNEKHVGIKKMAVYLAKRVIAKNSDYYFACSEKSAYGMFPKDIVKKNKYKFIPNAIDVQKFKFNKELRDVVRRELNISDDTIVIGNVARLTKVKNHEFMIKLTEELDKEGINVKLLLIGDGELRKDLERKVLEKGLESKIIFLGMKEDVEKYYNAMDLFILSSFSEGFGMVVLEAQANGLNCVVSSTLPKEVETTDLVDFCDINNTNEWKNVILKKMKVLHSLEKREEYNKRVASSNFNIKTAALNLKQEYIKISNS